ncbi:MAG: DUF58 domain-containing protein [Fluviicola sp.]|nr:DUF58 domain-containing protein [Fluviicola sp.]
MISSIRKEDLAQFGNLELLAKQVVEGFITGLHKSPFHGFSVEFAEHRLYNPGESTRHIDWKLYGRSEKLFTKKYEEETNLRCQLVIDTSSSMYYRAKNGFSKLEFSVLAAASLIELMKKQRDAVGVSLFNEQLDLHTPAKSSMAHHRFLLHEMEQRLHQYNEQSKRKTEAVAALHDVAELCHKRSLIIIFTDLMDDPSKLDELIQAIQHLKHNKHEVVLFHVVDQQSEVDFNLENRPVNLVDMETGETMKLHPREVKKAYTEAIQQHFQTIALKCSQYGVDFMPADIQHGMNTVLTEYLLKRQKLV